ncbi:MAG: 6-phosphofructokinase [Clostridia bacterium]
MDKKIRRIGVLTSGGDAPGMNPAVRAVVRTATAHGISCLGIRRGYNGLINGDVIELDARSVDGISKKGGTILYTARCLEFMTEEGLKKAVNTCKYLGLDAVVVIGGDGSFRGAQTLSRAGIPAIGIPGTIDNDITCTDYTIGFDTAQNTAIDAIDKLSDTMQSHERCSIVEVMGREAGHLALNVGIATGATAILVPECDLDIEAEIVEKMRAGKIRGRNHHVIIVAEGYGNAEDVGKKIFELTGIETRLTILGHIQRGGTPTSRDRVMATVMGHHAVDIILQNKTNRIVRYKNSQISDVDIEEGLAMEKDLDNVLYNISRTVSH